MTTSPMSLPSVAVLAGGLATRMRPYTETIPKSLLPVAGKPFVCHQLELLAKQGVRHVVFCLGHLGEQIIDAVGTGSAFGLRVDYSHDGETPLGTGGALAKASYLLGDEFFVLYGDSYLRCNYWDVYRSFLETPGRDCLMTIYKNDNAHDSSNVVFENGKILLYDKRNSIAAMRHIDYGLGLVRTRVLSEFSDKGSFDLAMLYEKLVRESRASGFEVSERFYEIGSREGWSELDKLLNHED